MTEAEMESTCCRHLGVLLCREDWADDNVRELTVIIVAGPVKADAPLQKIV